MNANCCCSDLKPVNSRCFRSLFSEPLRRISHWGVLLSRKESTLASTSHECSHTCIYVTSSLHMRLEFSFERLSAKKFWKVKLQMWKESF
jgi:hypothetical protein